MKRVVCLDEDIAGKKYDELKKLVENCTKSKKKPTYEQLLESIEQKILNLKENHLFGKYIPKINITKQAIKKYGTNKIFKVDLVGYFRLLYTLSGHEDCVQILILDFVDHDEYNKIFDYKKK